MNAESDGNGAYIILGGSGDIGGHVARLLSEAGQTVILASRASDRLNGFAKELDAPKRELDATNLDEVEACFAATSQEYGQVLGVVNCVGSVLLKPAHLTRDAEWHTTIATNLTSAFATVRAAGKTMCEDGGSVVLMSSAAARVGLPNHEAIAPLIEAVSR